jgi:hypothetical protein
LEDAVIKFNESRLPEQARERLLALDARRVEEAAAAAARLPYEITDQKITERVRASQERHAQRHNEIHALCSRIRQFLNSLPPNVDLVPAPPVTAKPRQGETLAQAVDRTRDEIMAAQNHLSVVKAAPLPKADAKKLAAVYVQQLAARGCPSVAVDRDQLKVAFTAPNADTLAHHLDIAALMAWLYPSQMTQAFEREIDALGETAQPMPAAERERRASELAANLEQLERQEETLIEMAASEGVDIMRRADADPRAVLGVSIVAKVKALQAA